MLQQKSSHPQEPSTWTQVRVTPEELSRAIAALEARQTEEVRRREEEAQRNAGTLSLQEAVDNLALHFSKEQIWDEVKNQRMEDAAKSENTAITSAEVSPATASETIANTPEEDVFHADETTEKRVSTGPSEANFFTGIIIACLLLITGLICLVGRYSSSEYSVNQRQNPSVSTPFSGQTVSQFPRLVETLDDDFFNKLRQSQGQHPVYHILRFPIEPIRGLPLNMPLYPARAIPDGYTIHDVILPAGPPFEMQMFRDFQNGVVFLPADKQISSIEDFTGRSSQSVITTRYDGCRYLRCWIQRNEIKALKNGGAFSLFTRTDAVDAPPLQELVPLTIALSNGFQTDGYSPSILTQALSEASRLGDVSRIVVPQGNHLILDEHAWENFPGRTASYYSAPAWLKTPGKFSPSMNNFEVYRFYAEFDASSVIKKLEQIPNYQPFRAGDSFLRQVRGPIPQGSLYLTQTAIPVSQILVDVRPKLHQPYTFVKIEGRLYLQGWVAGKMAEKQMQGHYIDVYNDPTDPELGYSPTPVRLRLDQCQIQSFGRGRFVTVTDVHLDKHAWEKW